MSCLDCRDGYVWAIKRRVGPWEVISGPSVFRCPCGRAKTPIKNEWSPSLKTVYDVVDSHLQCEQTPTPDEPTLIQEEQDETLSVQQNLPALPPSSLENKEAHQGLNYAWVIQMFEEKRTHEPEFLEALKKHGREKFVELYRNYRNQKTSLSMQGNES